MNESKDEPLESSPKKAKTSKGKNHKIRPHSMEECGGNCAWFHKGAWNKLSELSDPSATTVYMALVVLENRFQGKTKKDWFFVSAKKISEECGVSIRTVFNKLNLLVSEKLILRQTGKFKGKSKGHEANNYALVQWPYIPPAQPFAENDDMQNLHKSLCKLNITPYANEVQPQLHSKKDQTHRASPEVSPRESGELEKRNPATRDSDNGATANAAQVRSRYGNGGSGTAKKRRWRKGDIKDGKKFVSYKNGTEEVWTDLEPSCGKEVGSD